MSQVYFDNWQKAFNEAWTLSSLIDVYIISNPRNLPKSVMSLKKYLDEVLPVDKPSVGEQYARNIFMWL